MGETMEAYIKRLESDPYDTVFLIGNGVVENGDRPLVAAVNEFCGEKLSISPMDLIAYLVFQARLFSQRTTDPESKSKEREKLHKLKTAIARSFASAQSSGEIHLRTTRDFVTELASGKTILVTTNWDTLLVDRYVKSRRHDVVSLHGNFAQPTGLYLPTETTLEPYWDLQDEVFQYLKATHRMTITIFERAKRVVVWGHSLSMYDAEVCLLMSCTQADIGQGREFFVIDPESLPVEKLKVLAGSKNVTHIDPTKPPTSILRQS